MYHSQLFVCTYKKLINASKLINLNTIAFIQSADTPKVQFLNCTYTHTDVFICKSTFVQTDVHIIEEKCIIRLCIHTFMHIFKTTNVYVFLKFMRKCRVASINLPHGSMKMTPC